MSQIKALRNRTGLSQSKFAETFGVPVRTLQQWEQHISAPPPYVIDMLEKSVDDFAVAQEEKSRHSIPERTEWKVCIDDPFLNCEKVYPTQQRKVRALIDDITEHSGINEIRIFGSSVTERCHMGSDVDIYVEADDTSNLIGRAHDFEFDLWTNETVDDRLREEIMAKGVKVYG